MSDTMVGQVADAVLSTLLDRRGIRQPLEAIRDSDPETWAELRDTIGRLAIEALRVPNGAMRLAGARGAEPDCHLFQKDAEGVWRAMIGVALGEE